MEAAAESAQALKTVLVVEDDAYTREFIATSLQLVGYRVRSAVTGQEALERVRAEPPDLVLLDLLLPEPDGWEIYRRIRAEESTRAVPVLVTSILADYEQGFDAPLERVRFLSKPFQPQELIEAVTNILR